MTTRTFFIQLLALSAFVATLLWGLNQFVVFEKHQFLSWLTFGFFILFSILTFSLGFFSSLSKNPQFFGQFFLISTAFKMLGSILLVLFYLKTADPKGQLFVVPFFLVYLCYTFFEVYFMGKLAKNTP